MIFFNVIDSYYLVIKIYFIYAFLFLFEKNNTHYFYMPAFWYNVYNIWTKKIILNLLLVVT